MHKYCCVLISENWGYIVANMPHNLLVKVANFGHDFLSVFGIVFLGSGVLHRIAPDFMALQSA